MTASVLPQTGYQAGPDRRRLLAFCLVVLLHILLAGLLLLLAPPQSAKRKTEPSVFTMLPDLKPAPKPAPRAKRTEGAKASKPTPAARAPVPKPPPAPKTADAKPFDLGLMESVDISKLPNQKAANATAGTGETGVGPDSETAYGPGEGPGGERLYNAEWQREPTHAELAFYLPNGAPQGAWAMIACRTIDGYRVEDCRALGEYPGGGGLAHALTLAAWQFRVRPPRVGGKAMVGSWVRIRFDFSKASEG